MLTNFNKVNTHEDLEKLNIGSIHCDITERGGGVGFYSQDVAKHFEVDQSLLPRFFGAGCNYMGGGVRGTIFPSSFSDLITGEKANGLKALADACVRVYKTMEDESGMNADYEDGDTNWNARATEATRKAGAKSAY